MSVTRLETRITKLEQSAAGEIKAILWAGQDQDAAQIEAQHVAAHPVHAGRVLVVGWQERPPHERSENASGTPRIYPSCLWWPHSQMGAGTG